MRRLKVNFSSTTTWALDELTGERYELAEGDLCRYSVDKSYLRERFDQLLKKQLIDFPLTVHEQEPYLLGNYRMGDQRLPVVLVSRLWEPRHADKMDTELRQSHLGLSIVLTTSQGVSRRFLGPGIVVSLDTLTQEVDGQVSIDLSRLDAEVRRRQSAAVVTDVPRLIKDDARSGVLVGPWPDPWTLTKKEWIDVIEVFVNGWKSGRRKWTRAQIESTSGATLRTMAEFFRGAPEWQNYLRGADGNDKPRLWELNIGRPDHQDAAHGSDAKSAESDTG